MDCSPPGSSVHGILEATILEWVAVPSPEDLPNPGIKPRSPALLADSLLSEPPGKPKGPLKGQPVLTCFGFSSRFLPAVEEVEDVSGSPERPACVQEGLLAFLFQSHLWSYLRKMMWQYLSKRIVTSVKKVALLPFCKIDILKLQNASQNPDLPESCQ